MVPHSLNFHTSSRDRVSDISWSWDRKPSTNEDSSRRGADAQIPTVDIERKFGEGGFQLRCHPQQLAVVKRSVINICHQ
ncbi:hypothetical protein TNCV_4459781 [Trichonephila clavipes]|nr:hypothetical protein TNCV_4459781 [Trichonephila clavipes]